MARPRNQRGRCSTVLHCDGPIMCRVDALIREARKREVKPPTFADIARRAFAAGLAVLEEEAMQAQGEES